MPSNVFKDLQSQYAVLGYNPDTAAYEARVSQLASFNLVAEKGTVQIQPQNDYYPLQWLTVDADALGLTLQAQNGELRLQSQGGLLTLDTSGALIANGGTWSVDYTGRAAFYTATVTGAVTAASFAGDGSQLTGWMLGASKVQALAADEVVATNSAALTESATLQMALTAGNYFVECMAFVVSSAYATAGAQTDLQFTGTATAGNAEFFFGANPSTTAATIVANLSGDRGALSNLSYANSSLTCRRAFKLTVTAGGTLKMRAAQASAVAGTVAFANGSYLKITRLS